MKNVIRKLLRTCYIGSLVISGAIGQTQKLATDVRHISASAKVDVIVQFVSAPADTDIATLDRQGAKLKTKFKNIRAGLFNTTGSSLANIASNPRVAYISLDRPVSGALEFAEPTVGANTAFDYGWTGSGIGVAVIDSGIASEHPDLRYRVVYSQNFVAGESRVDDPYGHGTHVTGIVGGNGLASTGPSYTKTFRGIAPKAQIVNLRVLDASGHGVDSAVIQAIDRAIELKSNLQHPSAQPFAWTQHWRKLHSGSPLPSC